MTGSSDGVTKVEVIKEIETKIMQGLHAGKLARPDQRESFPGWWVGKKRNRGPSAPPDLRAAALPETCLAPPGLPKRLRRAVTSHGGDDAAPPLLLTCPGAAAASPPAAAPPTLRLRAT